MLLFRETFSRICIVIYVFVSAFNCQTPHTLNNTESGVSDMSTAARPEDSTDNTTIIWEQVLTISTRPMTKEQCALQLSAKCRPDFYNPDKCIGGSQALTIACDMKADADEIGWVAVNLSKPPIRAIKVDIFDGKAVTFSTFGAIREQVVIFVLTECISVYTTSKLSQLGFSTLLHFMFENCNDMVIKSTDFQRSKNLRIISFRYSTIRNTEVNAFDSLSDLRILSWESGLDNLDKPWSWQRRDYIRRLHCGCEFQWLRHWWKNHSHLLHPVGPGEIFSIPQSWISTGWTKNQIYLPINCSADPFPTGPRQLDLEQAQFSVNEPSYLGNDTTECSIQSVESMQPFPGFSTAEMEQEQCVHQFSGSCRPRYTPTNCTVTQLLEIDCDRTAELREIHQLAAFMSSPPLRAVSLSLYDGSFLTFDTFAGIRNQVVSLSLFECATVHATATVHRLQLAYILQFQLNNCLDLIIKKADFEKSKNLKIIEFRKTTIQNIEFGTFTDLTTLKIISLERGLGNPARLTRHYRDYLTRLHCACEFHWYRRWWNSNNNLLTRAEYFELISIPNVLYNDEWGPEDVYLPVDCTNGSLPVVLPTFNYPVHTQRTFSVNEPNCTLEKWTINMTTNRMQNWTNETQEFQSSKGSGTINITAIATGIPLLSVFVGILLIVLVWRRTKQRKQKTKRRDYTESLLKLVSSDLVAYYELPRWSVKLTDHCLGVGHSGQVMKGVVKVGKTRGKTDSSTNRQAAVKILKYSTATEEEEFLLEMSIMMKIGHHTNIVNLAGVVLKEKLMMVLEYCELGSLNKYLRIIRPINAVQSRRTSNDKRKSLCDNMDVDADGYNANVGELMTFAFQVSRGMEYLVSKNVIHRDLAARNILVTSEKILKIADFGMAREITEYILERDQVPLPVRWMAPESILSGRPVFSTQTDVWSFGIVMWEIFSFGEMPYALEFPNDIIYAQFCELLKADHRLSIPKICPPLVAALIEQCWSSEPSERPTFSELCRNLAELLPGDVREQYVVFDAVDMAMNKALTEAETSV